MELTKDFIKSLLGVEADPNLQLPDPDLIQYYEDLQNRILWLDDEVGYDCLDFVSKIIRWNREDQGKPRNERKPIRIFFNSPGGDLDIEETLVSIINLSKTPVWGIALGMVASAASLIYLSCHRRLALPNSYFIFHQGSCANVSGSYSEVQAAMSDYKTQVEKMEKFYIENTLYPEDVIKKKIQSDWYIHSEEAKEYNVITDIIEDIDVLL